LDQTAVLTLDGVATEEQSYQSTVDDCKKGGAFPLHALTPSEVAKIGRVHLEAWIGPDKKARHEESWSVNESAPCHFFLTHEDKTWITDANGRVTTIDNVTHQVDVGQGDKPPWSAALPESDGEMDEAHRQRGWSRLGVTNSNGAQCVIWQDEFGEQSCAWSGGRQWGYSADGAGALHGGVSEGPGGSIILWEHPGKGASWRLETQAFSVGQPLDPRAFVVPANANPGTPR
jgi:hypothetical protein